jgi:hypothetical protein
MRIRTTCLTTILLMSAGAYSCGAQDFSADVVYLPTSRQSATTAVAPGHNSSRIYVSKEKMRLETHGDSGAVLVVNGKDAAAYALFPAKKEFEPLDGSLSEYFRVADAENACAEWESVAAQKVKCEKAGHEAVNGREAVKYVNQGASDLAVSAVWIDLELKFVVKWDSAGSDVELRNIQEGEQAAALFVLPDDYELSKPKKGTKKGFSGR